MEEGASSTSTFKSEVSGWTRAPLWWFLAFVVVLETLWSLAPDNQFTRTARLRYDEAGRVECPDVVIYGDSVADGGLNDFALAAEGLPDGRKLGNYSIPGTTALAAYPLLKRQTENAKPPRMIILAYSMRSYAIPLADKHFGRFLPLGDSFDAVTMGMPAKEWMLGMLCRLSFTLRYREELNHMLRYGMSGLASFNVEERPAFGYGERLTHLPRTRETTDTARSATGQRSAVFFDVDDLQPEYMARSLECFFELAKSRDIKLACVVMPIPDTVRLSRNFVEGHERFLRDIHDRHGVQLLLQEQPVLPAAQFSDGVHLTRQAAFEFSERLREPLRRWVDSNNGSTAKAD